MKLLATTSLAATFVFAGLGIALADDAGLAKARATLNAAMSETCDVSSEYSPPIPDTEYALKWTDRSYDPVGEEREGTLYELFCMSGAYNVIMIYMFAYEDSPASFVSFAEPTYDFDYEDGDETFTKLKKEPELTGFSATLDLVNPEFDPETMTVSNFNKWRGLGDAWSGGVWRFQNGRFVLSEYNVDPTYEANLDDPANGQDDKFYTIYKAGE